MKRCHFFFLQSSQYIQQINNLHMLFVLETGSYTSIWYIMINVGSIYLFFFSNVVLIYLVLNQNLLGAFFLGKKMIISRNFSNILLVTTIHEEVNQ
jgi:hypothetical protein